MLNGQLTEVPADSSIALCLACSSSILPKASGIFVTPCCGRRICPTCLSSNPRLSRYNPCLVCLGGVSVVSNNKGKEWNTAGREQRTTPQNIDGAVRDEDTFVVGD